MAIADRTLAEQAAHLDAERFVGRAPALATVDAALDGTSDIRVLYVHGPGGVGKSALTRAIARRASARGRTVVRLDGRTLTPRREAIADALAPVRGTDAVVILDEVDELASLRFELVDLLRTTLGAQGIIVVAGRVRPGPEWSDGGWDRLTQAIELRPLNPSESRELLARYDIDDVARVDPLVVWSGGYPLALTLAAITQVVPGRAAGLAATESDADLRSRLLDRLGRAELAGIDSSVLEVAAVAPVVDTRLLAAVLPGRPTRAAMASLRSLSVAEPVGHRVTLHRLVRDVVRDRLRHDHPQRYRDVVLAVADHLHARAVSDDVRLAYELADLIENPTARLGFGPSTSHYVDELRPGDVARTGDAIGATGTAWWNRVARWCDNQPGRVVVVRRADGSLAAMGIACSIDGVPAWALESIEVGPVVAHARAHGTDNDTFIVHDLTILEDPDDAVAIAEVIRVGNAAMWRRHDVRNPRHVYVTSMTRPIEDGADALGYDEVEELRRGDDERTLTTIMRDFGPGGLVGAIHSLICSEQCLGAPRGSGRGDAVVAALRSFHDDEALATSVLGTDPDAVRDEVRAAIGRAFTAGSADQQLRTVLERTYIDVPGGHAVAMRQLALSRSTLFRHLQRARDQLRCRVDQGA